MADARADGETEGLPLNQFTKSTLPGWRPGLQKYPLRLYVQLLELWWRQTELREEQTGPTMAGRLRGTALQKALALTAVRYDEYGQGRQVTGDELLAQPTVPADDQIGMLEQPAGATLLMRMLITEYGQNVQDTTIQSLQSFFEFDRGQLGMLEYISMWNMVYEEAVTDAGMDMNDIARSYVLLHKSGLSPKARHDQLRLRPE